MSCSCSKKHHLILTDEHTKVIDHLRQVGKNKGYRFKSDSIHFFAGISESKICNLFGSPATACKIAGCLIYNCNI